MNVLSTSDLVKMGWSRTVLMQIAHSKNSPAYKSPGGGKWYFNKEKFEKFVETRLKG